MKSVFGVLLVAVVNGCAVMTVSEDDLRPESADAVSFQATGRPTYDQVWIAAMKAMGTGMTVVESHKPSGTIKSRVGSAPTGKVVAFFITPTTSIAPTYRIETVSKKPMGLGQPERRNWERSLVEDFKAALAAR